MMKHWIKTLAKRRISLFAGLQFVLTLVDNGVFLCTVCPGGAVPPQSSR